MDPNNKYSQMQANLYEAEAKTWSPNHRDPVVGNFDNHQKWKDYDIYLFKNLDTTNCIALDFGCGPGRCIVNYSNRFKQIDGLDIAQANLDNALIWCKHNNIPFEPKLYKSNGVDLSNIDSDTYDIVYSTICLQHICVHDIRFNLMKEFYRILKPGGHLCLQMGFGPGSPGAVGYDENNYDANTTNGFADTRVDNPEELRKDTDSIGFKYFTYDIRPVGPGDRHGNWIFFMVQK